MRKVLIILYYWPPAGGSAVQRWLKFSKYLPDFGWEPVVYVPENAEYHEMDPDLAREIPKKMTILSRPVTEPVTYYTRFVGGRKGNILGASMSMKSELKGISKLKHQIAWWIRSNFFIPDAHFMWIRPSVKYLKVYLKENPVDLIVTTGPPQSLHLIGLKLQQSLSIPWVADFRDPWTNIDFYDSLSLTRWADKKHHQLESKVLRSASHVIAIGWQMKDEFIQLGARSVSVITNGFDETDFSTGQLQADQKFSIMHLGTISATRNSVALWKAIAAKATDDRDFAGDLEIKLIGALNYSVTESIEIHGLSGYLKRAEFLPHNEGIDQLKKARVLLLLINNSKNAKGIITGKFFEYLAAGRPILLIGPTDGDAARIMAETGSGSAAGFDDEATIRKHIDHFYNLYRAGKLTVGSSSVNQYSRRELTGRLAEALDKVFQEKAGQVK